jgi:hypothetical protein
MGIFKGAALHPFSPLLPLFPRDISFWEQEGEKK